MRFPTLNFREYIMKAYEIKESDIFKFMGQAPLKELREDFTKLYILSQMPNNRSGVPFSIWDKPFQILFEDFLSKYLKYDAKLRVNIQKFKIVFIHRNLHRIRAFQNFFYSAAEIYINHELDKKKRCVEDHRGKNEEEKGEGEGEAVNKWKGIENSKWQLLARFTSRVKDEREIFFRKNEALKFKDSDDRKEEEDDDFDCDFELENVEDIWKKDILFVKMIDTPYEQILTKFDEIKKESERLYSNTESKKQETNENPIEERCCGCGETRDVEKIALTPERVQTNESDLGEGEIIMMTNVDEKRQGVKRKSDSEEGDRDEQIQEQQQQLQHQQILKLQHIVEMLLEQTPSSIPLTRKCDVEEGKFDDDDDSKDDDDDEVNDVNNFGINKEGQTILTKVKLDSEEGEIEAEG